MIKSLKNEIHQLLPILGFYVLAWIFNLLLISIISFFHFRLDHRLIEIENWIFDYSWTLNLFSKVGAFIIFCKYFTNSSQILNFDRVDFNILHIFKHEVLFFMLMNILVMSLLLQPKYVENVMFSSYFSFIHFGIVFVSFGVDLVVNKLFLGKVEVKMSSSLISALVLFIYYILVFPFGLGINIIFLSLLILFFVYFFYSDFSFANGSFYILLVLAPLFCIVGIDPVWGSKFSYLKPYPKENYFLYFIVLSFITNLYFYIKRRKAL